MSNIQTSEYCVITPQPRVNFRANLLSTSHHSQIHFNLMKRIASIACLLFSFIHNVHADLPELGDPTLQNFSNKEEAELGQAFYHALRASLEFVDDLQIEHYVKNLGQRLVTHSDAAGKNFRFFVINSDVINAFAGPDAYIGINSGLLLQAKNESQLASVMAHEISHVSQRHLARAVDRSGNATAASLATILAAILVSAQDPQAGQAVLFTGIAGAQQASLNFTRQNEYEADRIGISILAKAGISPAGMVEFFEFLLSQSTANDLEYLRTHPLNENRVSEARSRIKEEQSNLPSDTDDFKFARARLAVISSHQPENFIELNASASDVFGLYQKAIAQIKTRHSEQAIPILEKLAGKYNHPWIKLALAEAYEDENQSGRSMAVLEQLAGYYPGYLPVTVSYARALTASNQSLKSISLLKHQLQYDDDAVIHQQLAQAYYINGQTAAALESTGNQYLREGYIDLAIQQFENALRQPDLNESSRQRLETKKDQLKEKEK